MTHQQLLEPRFEVIAPWPNGYISVGTILIESLPNYYRHSTKTGISYRVENIDQYPHLFRPLHWSERREEGDMPEYVKCGENGKPRKLESIHHGIMTFVGGRKRKINDKWLPSSVEEFTLYKESQKD